MRWDATEYLEKSRENIAIAERSIELQAADAAVSRAYYAAFQAAISGIIKFTAFRPGQNNRWSHSAVAAQVGSELAKRQRLIPSQMTSTLSELIGKRHTADYGPGRVSQLAAGRLVVRARSFVDQLEAMVDSARGVE